MGVSRREAGLTDDRYAHLALDLEDLPTLVSSMEHKVSSLLRKPGWERVGLVNNAASAALLGPIQSIEPEELMKLYAVNVVAPIWLMGFFSRHCPPAMPLRVVNVSSGAAVSGVPGLGAYGSSKAALQIAGMVAAAEWESNVPHAPTRTDGAILSFEPNIVDTPMQDQARSPAPKDFPWVGMFHDYAKHGRLLPPAVPAAEIVRFLESDRRPAFTHQRLEAPA